MLTQSEIKEIDHEIELVPYKKAALIESLKIVQKHRGWISNDSVTEIADYLEMSPAFSKAVSSPHIYLPTPVCKCICSEYPDPRILSPR